MSVWGEGAVCVGMKICICDIMSTYLSIVLLSVVLLKLL